MKNAVFGPRISKTADKKTANNEGHLYITYQTGKDNRAKLYFSRFPILDFKTETNRLIKTDVN